MNRTDLAAERRRQQDWLRTVMQLSGLTRTALAKKADVAPSTVLRLFDDERDGLLTSATIARIVAAFGVALPGSNGVRPPGFADSALDRLETAGDEDLPPTRSRWRVRDRSLELRGYLPGDEVEVDSAVGPAADDIVCAQIYDFQLGTAETVLRVYEPPFLTTATLDRALHAKPLVVDQERARIVGTVVESVRRRTPPAPAQ